MALIISGPGVGLQLPQNLYPSYLLNAPLDLPNNYIGLAAGDELPIPAGRWLVDVGNVTVIQYQDPVTGIWRSHNSGRAGPMVILSDGFTRRVANLTGCPVAAVVANGGSGFTQATATITSSIGGSTWQPVVGGSLSLSTISNAGKNYGVAPLLFIPAPPNPGVQATGYCTIANGTVSAVSFENFGAGYLSAPTAVILPNPTDPNFGTVTQATIVLVLNAANSGAICAALCTNSGAALATLSALTLTAAGGGGSGATLQPVILQTVTGTSIVAGGVGLGSASAPALITTVGGQPTSVSAIVNPAVELTKYRPRQAQISGTANAGGTITALTIVDPGLFAGTPNAVVVPGAGGLGSIVGASITLTMGSLDDVVLMQPL